MKSKVDRPIQLLLVNEIRLMGNVIVAALEAEPDIDVIACVTTYAEALQIVRAQEVDVAVVSTRLPDHGGLRLTNAISEISPHTKVLALGLTEEKKRVLRYVEAGASEYILIEVGPVKNHVHNILEKLNVSNRGEAAAYLAYSSR